MLVILPHGSKGHSCLKPLNYEKQGLVSSSESLSHFRALQSPFLKILAEGFSLPCILNFAEHFWQLNAVSG